MSDPAASRRLWKWKILKAVAHARRHPYVFAIIGFASGLASFLLVDRQEKAAGLIAVLMLAGWVWLLLEEPIRRFVRLITGFSIPPTLIRFTTQVVHQESFFFVLPFFAITTTWTSPQTLFTVMIGIAGLISIIDPVYHGRLAKHRWIYLAYHCLALSVVLLTALPIIVHLTTWETYAITTALTVVLALPSIIQIVPLGGAVKGAGMVGIVLLLGVLAWVARPAVPPATLWLTDSTITHVVDKNDLAAGRSLRDPSAEAVLERGLYAYTAIRAPRGLHENVYHEWIHEGHAYDRIPLEVTGGRKAGYRAWTHKMVFPPHPEGEWRVRVTTESGQMLGEIRFRISE